MAWRRRWVIVVPTIVAAYLAVCVSSLLRDTYKSETLIQVVPQRVPDSYVQSTVTMRTEERLSALSQQVLSRTALEALIGELNLYPDERRRRPMQDVVDRMRENISVEIVNSRGGQTADAFYVRFMYPDPALATRVTQRLGGLFIDLNARDRGELAGATDRFLQSQLAETRASLEAQERRLEQFRLHNAGRLPTQQTFNMQAIQTTQLAVQALVESVARDRDRKLMLERLYNEAQSEPLATPVAAAPTALPPPPQPLSPQPSQPSSQQAATPDVPGLSITTEQQLANARNVLAALEVRLTPEHPDIARTRRLVRELEARVKQEARVKEEDKEHTKADERPATAMTAEQLARASRLGGMRAEIESLDRQLQFKEAEEQRQRNLLADYQRRLEETPGVESEWTSLTRDYDTRQAAYKDLLAKSEQSKVAMELERRQVGEQFRILDPARPPVRPTGLRHVQVNAGGTAFGLLLGLIAAAWLEWRDRTFKTARDVGEVTKLPVLANVPLVPRPSDVRRAGRIRLAVSVATVAVIVVAGYGAWVLRLWQFIR